MRSEGIERLKAEPRTPDTFLDFYHALGFVIIRAPFPPLGLQAVAAMRPAGGDLRSLELSPNGLVDDDRKWADDVCLWGMSVHKQAAHSIAARSAALNWPVIAA